MSKKLTEARVATAIEILNTLICEEGLLTGEQRQPMVITVATLGALGERIRQAGKNKAARKAEKAASGEKKPREPDPVFPRSGTSWTEEDEEIIRTLIHDLPDEEIDHHIRWLSDRLGRTPFAIAMRIVSEGRRDEEWPHTFRPMTQAIREEVNAKRPADLPLTGPDDSAERARHLADV
ncbi:hypothetical protein MUA03_17355 [Enterobacteriaceae bacterium H16N7]|nr:hypothetical protein [Dryocola clanedunensis]